MAFVNVEGLLRRGISDWSPLSMEQLDDLQGLYSFMKKMALENVTGLGGVATYKGVKEEDIKLESKFVDDLGADSLDLVELIMSFEDKFEIEISDEEAEKIVTVKNALDYIDSQLKK